MAMKCMNCGKGVMYGHNVSHSKRRTPRTFKPNLQVARVSLNGRSVKLKLCTKCVRMTRRATAAIQMAETAKAAPATA